MSLILPKITVRNLLFNHGSQIGILKQTGRGGRWWVVGGGGKMGGVRRGVSNVAASAACETGF